MIRISRSTAWIIASVVMLLSACASSSSALQEKATEQPVSSSDTPGAVQILSFAPSTQGLANTTSSYTPTPTPSPQPSSTPTAMMTLAATEEITTAGSAPSCTNQAEFIKHLTVGDFTMLHSGEFFAKLWQVKNIGTCNWTQDYELIFSSGSIMDGPQSIPLPEDVAPGETIDLRVDMVAPNEVGTFTGNWMLQDDLGQLFGVGATGDQPLAVNIVIGPTPHPTPGCARCNADVDASVNP